VLQESGSIELRGTEIVLRPLAAPDAPALAAVAAESRERDRFTTVPNGAAEAQAYARALNQRAAGDRYAFIGWHGRAATRSGSPC
jgi:hypothetical protein